MSKNLLKYNALSNRISVIEHCRSNVSSQESVVGEHRHFRIRCIGEYDTDGMKGMLTGTSRCNYLDIIWNCVVLNQHLHPRCKPHYSNAKTTSDFPLCNFVPIERLILCASSVN